MNSVNIIGNIGHDLEIRHTGSGKAVMNVNIAVNDYNKEVHWFRIVLWNEQAENTKKFCAKGSKIGITGRLANNKYTDNSGKEIVNTEIIATSVEFLSHQEDQKKESNYSNNSSGSASINNQSTSNQSNNNQTKNTFTPAGNDNPFQSKDDAVEISDDDLPF